MAEETEEVLDNKDIEVKGINTVADNIEEIVEEPAEIKPAEVKIETPKTEPVKKETTPKVVQKDYRPKGSEVLYDFAKDLEYKIPETQEEAFTTQIGDVASRGGQSNIKGFTGLIDAEAVKAIYEPVNLTDAMPDAAERAKFKAYNNDKLVNIFDNESIGITFEKDLEDVYKFKQRQYHHLTKQFIDDLDENQSWYTEVGLSAARLIGNTAVATAGNLLGSIYAAGSALINLDSTKLYDNMAYDALDYIQGGLDTHLAIYGGSDVYNEIINPETGLLEFEQKGFLTRFINDPLKSLNADVVPAASFVAGAVVSELLASAATASSGGLASGFLAANTARLTLQASKLFSKTARMAKFSKASRLIKGLDNIPGAEAAKLNRLTNAYRSSMGTVSAGYRSSAYESALIGKDTQDSTYNSLLVNHHKKMGGTITEDGIILDKDGNQLETYIEPTELEKRKYKETAESAGTTAYFMNVPLVAGSHFIQMPSLFRKNYSIANTTARQSKNLFKRTLDNLKLGGHRIVDGKRIANVNANKYLKALGYGKASIKGGITEGFEEFAQGGIQEGLVDYYANDYSQSSNLDIAKMANSISKQSAAFLNTTEGQDSVTIGAIMGMLGIRLPFKTDASGKTRFNLIGTGFGGIGQEIRQAKESIKNAKDNVDFLNKNGLNPMLAANFKNSLKQKATQQIKDEAALEGNVKAFKDAEHAQLFSGVYNRVELGLGDSVIQDIEILEDMSLDLFNEQFSAKDADGNVIEEFTEKSKEEALKKAKETATGMLESIAIVKELTNVQKPDLIQKAIAKVTGKKIGPNLDVATIKEGMEEQMAYLNSTVQNTLKREKDLTQQIQDITGTSLNMDSLNKVVAQIAGVNLNSKKLEFTNRAEEVKREILKDWKESDPVNYNMNLAKVEPLLNDILGLKIRRAEAAKMYQGLFTPEKAEQFANFQIELDEARSKEIAELARKEAIKNVDKARNASQVANAKENEASVNSGNTPATDKKINEDTVNGLSEIKNILDDENITGEEEVNRIMKILDNKPGLLSIVKERLLDKGFPLTGASTTQAILLRDADGSITTGILNELEELQELNVINKNGEVFLESYTGQNNQAEGTPGEFSTEELAGKMEFDGTANNYFTFINSYQYVIGKDGKVKLDDKGNPIMMDITKDKTFVKNYDVINDPDFLTNQDLQDNPTYFTFKISDNDYNKQSNRTDNNMAIDVLYTDPKTGKEILISRLPTAYDNSPQQLKELRKEIIKREKAGQDTTAEVSSNRIQEIKKEKEVIKKKLQENLDAKKEAPVADTQASDPDYNFNPSNVSEKEREKGKKFLLDQLGNPLSIEFESKGKDSVYKFTFKDGTYIETSGKGSALSLPKGVSEKIVELSKTDGAYDIKFLIGLNKLAEEQQLQTSEVATEETFDESTAPGAMAKFKADKNTKQQDLLQTIRSLEPTDMEKKLITALRPYLKGKQVFVNNDYTFGGNNEAWSSPLVSSGRGYGATISFEGDVLIFKKNNYRLQTLIHESLHTLTFSQINNHRDGSYNPELVAELSRIFEVVKNSKLAKEKDSQYALSNLDEFVAEAFGNESFRQQLSYLEDVDGSKSNLFKKFLDALRNFLKSEYGFEMPNSALESILSAVESSLKPTTTTQQTSEVTEEEFKEFTDNATVSDARINAIVNKIKAGTELTTQEQAMREEKATQVEEALQEDTTTEVDAEQAELKAELNALNEELKGLAGSIQVDLITNKTPKGIFGKVSSLAKMAERKKEEKRKELEEDFGKKNIERAEAINKNFDNIVKAIETSGIQIFLNPETNKHKNC